MSIAMVAQGNLAGLLGLRLLDLGQALNFIVITLHLLIAALLGMGFGVIFRYQPGGYAATSSSGLLYGLLWWIVGPLTLMPILLGATPEWTVEIATKYLASLVGHLAYGAALGILFYIMEIRFNPWWVSQRRAHADRMERRNTQALTSAPALWAFVVVIALIVPIVLGK